MKFTLKDLRDTIKKNNKIVAKAIIDHNEENGEYVLKSQECNSINFSCIYN